MKLINAWLLSNGLQRFWLHHRDCYCALIQTCNFGAVTPLGDGIMSAFVFLSTAIARALTVQVSGKAHGDADYTAMVAVVYWRLRQNTLVVKL